MSKQYVTLAKDIVRLVGGKENVTNAFHCQTRVRFSLADEGKADQAAYMAHHHGPTDSSHVRQEENRRRKPARAVRLPH